MLLMAVPLAGRPEMAHRRTMRNYDWTLAAFRSRFFYLIYAIPMIFIGPFAYIPWGMGGELFGNLWRFYYNLAGGNWIAAFWGALLLLIFLPLYLIPLWVLIEGVAFLQRRGFLPHHHGAE